MKVWQIRNQDGFILNDFIIADHESAAITAAHDLAEISLYGNSEFTNPEVESFLSNFRNNAYALITHVEGVDGDLIPIL